MALFESETDVKLFGLTIIPGKKKDNLSPAISLPIDEEGATYASGGSSAAAYGIYVDIDGTVKNDVEQIRKCRDISLYPEIDIALQDIINEAIPQEQDTPQIELDLTELLVSDGLKDKIQKEFDIVLSRLRYNELSADIFRRWYIDGRLYFQIIVDKTRLQDGIKELRLIDAAKIRKIKEVEKRKTSDGVTVVEDIKEYFVYNDLGFTTNATTGALNSNQGVKISTDAIIYVPSGHTDPNTHTVISHLHKAIRPANQLRMLEDSVVIYRIARAPERRIFYIDVGNLPKLKAEQYMKDIMNKYRNKIVYNQDTGTIRDDKRNLSALEDYWIPRREGKGTEITTLPGGNAMNQLDDVEMFRKKLYQALNVPISRIEPDTGFNLGRSTEISRDELKFQKFINRLRLKFSQLFFDVLRTQLILKGVLNDEEWDNDFRDNVRFKFQSDNSFTELKNLEILQNQLAIIPQVDQYLGKYFSKKYIQIKILNMSEEDIDQMEEEIEEEKDDPTAQPTIPGMPPMQPGDDGQQDQFGGQDPYSDPSQQGQPFGGQQQDPNAQQQPPQQ